MNQQEEQQYLIINGTHYEKHEKFSRFRLQGSENPWEEYVLLMGRLELSEVNDLPAIEVSFGNVQVPGINEEELQHNYIMLHNLGIIDYSLTFGNSEELILNEPERDENMTFFPGIREAINLRIDEWKMSINGNPTAHELWKKLASFKHLVISMIAKKLKNKVLILGHDDMFEDESGNTITAIQEDHVIFDDGLDVAGCEYPTDQLGITNAIHILGLIENTKENMDDTIELNRVTKGQWQYEDTTIHIMEQPNGECTITDMSDGKESVGTYDNRIHAAKAYKNNKVIWKKQ